MKTTQLCNIALSSTQPRHWHELARSCRRDPQILCSILTRKLVERGIRKGPDFLLVARVLLAPTPKSPGYADYLEQTNTIVRDMRVEEGQNEIIFAGKNAEGNYAQRLTKLSMLEKWLGFRRSRLHQVTEELGG